MEASKSMQIQIPQPCNQPWMEMKPEAQGRFCAACSLKVIDFTHYSDQDLIAFFTNRKPGRVCGRVDQEQLNRPIMTGDRWSKWLRGLLYGVFALMFHYRADAQQPDPKKEKDRRQPVKERRGSTKKIMGIMMPSDWRAQETQQRVVQRKDSIPETFCGTPDTPRNKKRKTLSITKRRMKP
jgi:hypothetical protein